MYAAPAGCGGRPGCRPRGARRGARASTSTTCEVRGPTLGPAPATAPAGMLVAARLGGTRLLDNIAIDIGRAVGHGHPRRRTDDPRIAMEELMFRTMLKSKIHRATVTQADLHYVGSVTDRRRPDGRRGPAGGRAGHHRRHRQRRPPRTYAIAGERGSGVIGINGAAAHLVHPGDLVILIAYGTMDDAEAREYQPRMVFVDADNRQIDLGRRSRPRPGRRRRTAVAAVSSCCSPSTSATPTPSSV